ncbi:MAG TPA: SDR family oxidoreductase [Thermoplasmata archaeon]
MIDPASCGPVLVTGASTGIGKAITEALSQRECEVYATARKDADLKKLRKLNHVNAVKLDVTNLQDAKRLASRIRKEEGRLHGLVNNAGIGVLWPLAETEVEDLHSMFDVNVYGVHRVTRSMLPLVIKSRGRIVNISSVVGLCSMPFLGAYEMSKHAIEAYSDALSAELDKYHVKVSIIEPGNFRSMIVKNASSIARSMAVTHQPTIMKSEVKDILAGYGGDVKECEKRSPPNKVVNAVIDALFSETPRRRYVVVPKEEEYFLALELMMNRMIQANEGNEYGLSRKLMHTFMDEAWSKLQKS